MMQTTTRSTASARNLETARRALAADAAPIARAALAADPACWSVVAVRGRPAVALVEWREGTTTNLVAVLTGPLGTTGGGAIETAIRSARATAPLVAVRILGIDGHGRPIDPLEFTTVGTPRHAAA